MTFIWFKIKFNCFEFRSYCFISRTFHFFIDSYYFYLNMPRKTRHVINTTNATLVVFWFLNGLYFNSDVNVKKCWQMWIELSTKSNQNIFKRLKRNKKPLSDTKNEISLNDHVLKACKNVFTSLEIFRWRW
jgi:hypothetical protein